MDKKKQYVRFTVEEIWEMERQVGSPEERERLHQEFQAKYAQCGECGIVTDVDGIGRQCRWCGCPLCVECDDKHEKMPEEYKEFYDDDAEDKEHIWGSRLPDGYELYEERNRERDREFLHDLMGKKEPRQEDITD